MGEGLEGSLIISIQSSFTPLVPISGTDYIPSAMLLSKHPEHLGLIHS